MSSISSVAAILGSWWARPCWQRFLITLTATGVLGHLSICAASCKPLPHLLAFPISIDGKLPWPFDLSGADTTMHDKILILDFGSG